MNDVIAAISTSNLTAGALSVIRLSGEGCFDILDRMFATRNRNYEGYRIYYGHIIDNFHEGERVDEVLVSIFKAPASFTGEDMVEISCHGGLLVTRRILTLALANGARQAVNGEFTRRAFLNGRIDLTQAEAVNDLITADNEDAARLAVNSLSGAVRKLLEPLIDDLESCIAHIEVNIDYPEYDDNGIITANEIKPLVSQWLERCEQILSLSRSSLVIREGIRTVIVGKPNVGKSSLLNALLHQDKAIVSEYAGTTRDLVEGDVRLDNVTLHLIDTAGIHESENIIENMGIERSRQALEAAQLVIVVLDGSDEPDAEDQEILKASEGHNRIIVYNKKDLREKPDRLEVSALNGDISELVAAINEMFAKDRIVLTQPALSNQRQIALLMQAGEAIKRADQALDEQLPLDLVGEELTGAWRAMKEILGEYSREDLLDGIFSRFCVGK